MFDLTNPTSFNNVKKWNEESKSYLQSSVPKLLIGNKVDMKGARTVKMEEAQELADCLEMEYIETSAKTAENVKEAFMAMTRTMLEKVSNNVIGQSETVGSRLPKGRSIKKAWCCS